MLVLASNVALDRADAVDATRLAARVASLQATGSRVAGTPGFAAASALVEGELSSLGLSIERTTFAVRNPYDGDRPVVTENLVSFLGPSGGPRIVLIAHLDSRGAADPKAAGETGWRWDRSPAPGADDNGSGCAALLEVARVLRDLPLATRVDLAFTGAEEMASIAPDGFMENLGAERLADAYAGAGVRGAIAVDMLLRPLGARVYSDGRLGSAELADTIVLAAQATGLPTVDHRVAPSFTYSDHGSFWAIGVPAVLVIEDDFHHARYHAPDDRLDPADPFYSVEHLHLATRALVAAVVILSSS
jgi:hypothetical protein